MTDDELSQSVVIDHEMGLTFDDFAAVVAERDAARAQAIRDVADVIDMIARSMDEDGAFDHADPGNVRSHATSVKTLRVVANRLKTWRLEDIRKLWSEPLFTPAEQHSPRTQSTV